MAARSKATLVVFTCKLSLLILLLSVSVPETRASAGAVLFEDDFDRGIPGWTAVQPRDGLYRDGPMRWQYDIISSAFIEQSNIYTDSPAGSPSAVAVMLINDTIAPEQFTFRARLTAGDNDGFGLIFGYHDETNFFRVTFAREARTAFPWTGWNVDRKVDGATQNLFGAGTPGHVTTFVNAANRPFDVTVTVGADNRFSLTVVDNPTGASTEYRLVQNQPLPAAAGGHVGLMTWGMMGDTPRGFRIGQVSLEPVPLTGNPNALSNWTPVVPPNAAGSSTLTSGLGQPSWWLAVGKDGPFGVLHEDSDSFGPGTTIGGNSNIDFVAPSLVAGDVNWSNYVVSARIIPRDDDGHGILLRYKDSTNFYRVSLASQATATGRPPKGLAVQKNVNRTWSEIFRESAVKFDPVPNTPYDLVAEISGNRLRLLVASHPESATRLFTYGPFDIAGATVPTGNVGVFSWGQNRTEFDFVRVQEGVPIYVVSEFGEPVPARGLQTFLSGSVVAASVPASIETEPGVRRLATGWTGTGSVPAGGANENVTFALTQFSTLQWNWRTEFQVLVTAEEGGEVSSPGGWFATGTQLSLAAHPNAGYLFAGWQGDLFSAASNLTVVVDRPYTLAARFTADSDEDGLPDEWELAYFGHLNASPNDDFDNDGRTNAEEFRLGTNPVVADIFRISGITVRGNLSTLEITNNTGTRYSVEMSTNLPGNWASIATHEVATNFVTELPPSARAFWRLKQPAPSADVLSFVPGSWTLAVLPDTQNYTISWPEIFEDQTRWIVENRDRYNIQYVFHLGDIVNNNIPIQWERAQKAMSILDGVVPYAIVPGNHDYGSNGSANNRQTLFNDYFPISKYQSWPTFGGAMESGRMDNTYHLFSAGGVDWLVLALEWGPRNGVAAWANQIVAQHPERKVMMITHAYMYNDDTRYDWREKGPSQSWNPYSYGTANDPDGTNDGEDLWQKLVKAHPNFVMAFNGHVLGDGLGKLSSEGDFGNIVHQMLVNYQMLAKGGEGFMRLVEFLPDGRTVQVKAYSPYHGIYKTDAQNQFVLTLDPPLK